MERAPVRHCRGRVDWHGRDRTVAVAARRHHRLWGLRAEPTSPARSPCRTRPRTRRIVASWSRSVRGRAVFTFSYKHALHRTSATFRLTTQGGGC